MKKNGDQQEQDYTSITRSIDPREIGKQVYRLYGTLVKEDPAPD